MTNYYDEVYGVGQSKFSSMPIYNQYFHIASDDAVATRVTRRRPRRSGNMQSVYDMLLQSGVDISGGYSSIPRAALRTIVNQMRPKNASGDNSDPNMNLPDQGTLPNTIDLLLDEAEGVCVAALPSPPEPDPRQERPEPDPDPDDQQEEYDPPKVYIEEAYEDEGEDDNFEESDDNEINLGNPPANDYNFDLKVASSISKIVEQTTKEYDSQGYKPKPNVEDQDSSGRPNPESGAGAQEMKDLIPEFVKKVYGGSTESKSAGVASISDMRSSAMTTTQTRNYTTTTSTTSTGMSKTGTDTGGSSGGGYP